MNIDHEATTRAWKVGRLLALFREERLTADQVAHWAAADWDAAADRAGIKTPSVTTRLQAVGVHAQASAVTLRASTAAHAAAPRSHTTARRSPVRPSR